MPQPTPYNKATNFTEYATQNPDATFPPAALDSELRNVETALDQTQSNLAILQRDDGQLRNGIVKPDSFSINALTMMRSTLRPRGAWQTATQYAALDLVDANGNTYIGIVPHTSGNFATDLAAGLWMVLSYNQTADPELAALASLSSSANLFPYFTGPGSAALAVLSPFARDVLAEYFQPGMFNRIVAPGGQLQNYVSAHADPVSPMNLATKRYADVGKQFGQCLLIRHSEYWLRLDRFNGKHLLINGEWREIPSGGVLLNFDAPLVEGGLSFPDVNYYIYARWDAGAGMTLQMSGTPPVIHEGCMVRQNDVTRSLVGYVRTDGSRFFVDQPTKRYVRTYYNDPGVYGHLVNQGDGITIGYPPWQELSLDLRLGFLGWGALGNSRETVIATAATVVHELSAGSPTMYMGIGHNALFGSSGAAAQVHIPGPGQGFPISSALVAITGVGQNYVTIVAGTGGGTSPTFRGSGYTGVFYRTSGSGA